MPLEKTVTKIFTFCIL